MRANFDVFQRQCMVQTRSCFRLYYFYFSAVVISHATGTRSAQRFLFNASIFAISLSLYLLLACVGLKMYLVLCRMTCQ